MSLVLTPFRVLDTKAGKGAPKAAVRSGGTVDVKVTGTGGIPATGVSAVVLNVTATDPKSAGFVTAYASGLARPPLSNLAFAAHQTVSNLVIVPVGANGKVTLYNSGPGTVQLVADVSGYYVAGQVTAAGGFAVLTPFRVLDTKAGKGAPKAAVRSGGTVDVKVTGTGGIPATGVSAVVLNVTATDPKSAGFITAYASGLARPPLSNLNFGAHQTVSRLVIAPVGPNGKVTLYNSGPGTVQLVADVSGYYVAKN